MICLCGNKVSVDRAVFWIRVGDGRGGGVSTNMGHLFPQHAGAALVSTAQLRSQLWSALLWLAQMGSQLCLQCNCSTALNQYGRPHNYFLNSLAKSRQGKELLWSDGKPACLQCNCSLSLFSSGFAPITTFCKGFPLDRSSLRHMLL